MASRRARSMRPTPSASVITSSSARSAELIACLPRRKSIWISMKVRSSSGSWRQARRSRSTRSRRGKPGLLALVEPARWPGARCPAAAASRSSGFAPRRSRPRKHGHPPWRARQGHRTWSGRTAAGDRPRSRRAVVGTGQALVAEQPGATGPAIELMAQGAADHRADGPANDQAEDASADFANPSHPASGLIPEQGKRGRRC